MKELTPLRELQSAFATNLANGEAAACHTMTEGLAVEAAFITIVADSMSSIDPETIDSQLVAGITRDAVKANGKLSLAQFLLNNIEKQ